MGENAGACELHVQEREAEEKQAEQSYQDLTQRCLPALVSEHRAGSNRTPYTVLLVHRSSLEGRSRSKLLSP